MNEQKTKVGKAAMFSNKSENPNAPKLRVLLDIDGTKYEIALWGATDDSGAPKRTKGGDKYWSGNVQRVGTAAPPVESGSMDEYVPPGAGDDDIPFAPVDGRLP